jgi:CRP-like cAMP-binding protein
MPTLPPLAIEALGWVAAAATLYAFMARTMIPLRAAAIVANVAFILYGAFSHTMPVLLLHALLLPLNILRLRDMTRLIAETRAASTANPTIDWLKPYMTKVTFPAGTTLFAHGDKADAAYFLLAGEVEIVEINGKLGPNALFGEIGLFTAGNLRTMTCRASQDVMALRITYEDFERLFYQNPQFGFYVLRLIVQRLQANAELAGLVVADVDGARLKTAIS